MRNWSEADEAYCSGQDDLESVDRVAHFLGIPYKVVDFQKEYWNQVFQPVLEAYRTGMTPNPDVLCNKEIKFKSLTDFVFSRTPSPDYLATGHYAQLIEDPLHPGIVNLREAVDPNKDQTYFLLQVSQHALKRVMFPIGHLTKPQVREIAVKANLPNANRKESMGLCFVGKRKFDQFIGEFTSRPGTHPGAIKDVNTGGTVGIHKGAMFYTVGQAANISGAPSRMFVVSKNAKLNTITVCEGSHHPSLYKDRLKATSFNWISGYVPHDLSYNSATPASTSAPQSTSPSLKCLARVRHRQELKSCTVSLTHSLESPSEISVVFDQPLRAITEGQYIGLYLDGVCLGGGIISETGDSYHTLRKQVPLQEKSNSLQSPSPTAESAFASSSSSSTAQTLPLGKGHSSTGSTKTPRKQREKVGNHPAQSSPTTTSVHVSL